MREPKQVSSDYAMVLFIKSLLMNEWKQRLGIPVEKETAGIDAKEDLPAAELFAIGAKEKIKDPLESPGIHTTLARAEDPNELRLILEHGLLATRNDDPNKDLIFYNKHGEGIKFTDDTILTYNILRKGFSVTLLLDERQLMQTGARTNETPLLETGRQNFVGGHTISGVKRIPPSSITGIVIGVGEGEYDAVYNEAIQRIGEIERACRKALSADERATLLNKMMTERIERCMTDENLREKLLQLKGTILRCMTQAFKKSPHLAIPIYDLDGKVLWPV